MTTNAVTSLNFRSPKTTSTGDAGNTCSCFDGTVSSESDRETSASKVGSGSSLVTASVAPSSSLRLSVATRETPAIVRTYRSRSSCSSSVSAVSDSISASSRMGPKPSPPTRASTPKSLGGPVSSTRISTLRLNAASVALAEPMNRWAATLLRSTA